MTAPAINESAYSAIAMIARNARIINAVINFLRRPRLEDNSSVAVSPCAVAGVFADMSLSSFIGSHRHLPLRPYSRSTPEEVRSRVGRTRMHPVQARLADRERDSKYATMYMTPNTIA